MSEFVYSRHVPIEPDAPVEPVGQELQFGVGHDILGHGLGPTGVHGATCTEVHGVVREGHPPLLQPVAPVHAGHGVKLGQSCESKCILNTEPFSSDPVPIIFTVPT